MLSEKQRLGIALLCDTQGRIVQVVRDDVNLAADLPPQAELTALFAPEDQDKIALFLEEVHTHAATFDWELHLRLGALPGLLYLVGGMVAAQVLVVGAFSRAAVAASFYEELMQINNEQMNALRAALKEQALLMQQQREREQLNQETYAELTRLNNELVTLQREVSKTNAELLAQRERYRLVSESISDYAYAYRIRPDSSIEREWVTGAFERITGYPPDEVFAGQGIQALVHPEDRDLLNRHNRQLAAGKADVAEFRILTKEGVERWLRDYGRPVWDEAQTRVTRVYGAVQDITERKQAEAQLQEYAERLAQMVDEKVRQLELERAKVIQAGKLAALGEMATGVAHELNQPLTSLLLDVDYLEALAERAQSGQSEHAIAPKTLLELAGNQRRDITRCRRIIDHLRAFGRISNEPPAPINLNEVLADTFILIEQRLRNNNVAVVEDLAPELPPVLAHSQKLEQVFLNLIGNAEHAMMEMAQRVQAGEAARPGYEKTLHIRSYTEGERVCIAIRDNGCGMTPEQQAHLFEPFFTTKPVGQGTGLGLSISYGIVTDFGGEIHCESAVNEGTTFTVWLPVACET